MLPIFSAIFVLILSVNLILGFNKGSNLIISNSSSGNIPNNKVNSQPTPTPIKKIPVASGVVAPGASANAVLVKDVATGTVLFSKNADSELPIASTTKIMTALIGAEHFAANDILQVKDLSQVSGSTMGLRMGEEISFRSLLYGMLLNSGNDAAYTIAYNYPNGFKGFLDAMNNRVSSLGLKHTHFTNPAGFDDPKHYSSASDLAVIAEKAMENPQLFKVVGTKDTTVASIDKSVVHPLKNLDVLLNIPGFLGIKTGTTPAAKENFVGLVERDNHRIITVVLGSEDRFGETQRLVDWAYSNHTW